MCSTAHTEQHGFIREAAAADASAAVVQHHRRPGEASSRVHTLHTAAGCRPVTALCRAFDAQVEQTRSAAWRGRLQGRRRQHPSQRVPSQPTFKAVVSDWDRLSKI